MNDPDWHRSRRGAAAAYAGSAFDRGTGIVLVDDSAAEHRKHIRTTNPIESTFATIRLRHCRTKGNGSRSDVVKDTTFQDSHILTQVAA